MGALVGQHCGDLVLLDRGHPAVGDEARQAAAHVAERHARGGEADGRVPVGLDPRVLLRIEVLDEMARPAVPGLPGVPGQRVGVEGHQLVVQQRPGRGSRCWSARRPPRRGARFPGPVALPRRQPEPGGDDVLAGAGARARARGLSGAASVEARRRVAPPGRGAGSRPPRRRRRRPSRGPCGPGAAGRGWPAPPTRRRRSGGAARRGPARTVMPSPRPARRPAGPGSARRSPCRSRRGAGPSAGRRTGWPRRRGRPGRAG